jgi:hypothetical protein
LKGLIPPDKFHYYFYRFDGIGAFLYFLENYNGKVEFVQGDTRLNKAPPQTDIDKIRPVMRQLERRLEAACSLPDLSVRIKESCSGVKCP